MEEREKETRESQYESQQDEGIFNTEEVVIEEMAIDGICGVY